MQARARPGTAWAEALGPPTQARRETPTSHGDGLTPGGLRSLPPSPRTPANLCQGERGKKPAFTVGAVAASAAGSHPALQQSRMELLCCCQPAARGRCPGSSHAGQGCGPAASPAAFASAPLSRPAGGEPCAPCHIPTFSLPCPVTQHPPKTNLPQAQSQGRLLLSAAKPDFSISTEEGVFGSTKGSWERMMQPWVLASLFGQQPRPRTYLHSSFLCKNKSGCYAKAGGGRRSREPSPDHS